MKKFFTLLLTTSLSFSFGQNLNFSDSKFKKLILSSTATNDIAFDFNGNSVKIDQNNDGEIQSSEANLIKVLNVKQDPKFKYTDETESVINEVYYQAYLPENVSDVLLFNNLEEIYVFDTKSIHVYFKNNDKIRIFHGFTDSPFPEITKNVTFENCRGITDLNNIQLPPSRYVNADDSKLTIINCPNINGNVTFRNNINELIIKNVLITNFTVENAKLLNKLTIANIPSLQKIYWNDDSLNTSTSRMNPMEIDASNNINLVEITINGDSYNDNATMVSKLNVNGNTNLKTIKGLNAEIVDFSTAGLVSLENLDIAYYNRYVYNNNDFVTYGNTKQVNLNGLPKLKKFKGFNQKFTTIDFSNNPLIEEIDLTNTLEYIPTLTINNLQKLTSLELSQNYNTNGFEPSRFSYALKDLTITNNPILKTLNTDYLFGLEKFELSNNGSLANFYYGFHNFQSNNDPNLYKLSNLIIKNNAKLAKIELDNTKTKTLDLSSNSSLKYLNLLDNTILENLVLNNTIDSVYVDNARLAALNLNNKTSLKVLSLKNIETFSNLNLLNNINLKTIYIAETGLKSLDLSATPNVETVDVYSNLFENLITKNNQKLNYIKILGGVIKKIDMSEAPTLTWFETSSIKNLEEVNLSKNTNLEVVSINGTKIKNFDFSHLKKLDWVRLNNDGIENINIKNTSIETLVDLSSITNIFNLCVDQEQLADLQQQYSDANVNTNCNLTTPDNPAKKLKIYPNPVKDYLEINSPNVIKQLEIVSLFGKSVATATPNTYNYKINLSHLKPGIYFIKMRTDKTYYLQSFIKK